MNAMTDLLPQEPGPPRVLLVEDNLAHAELIQRGLGEHRVASSIAHVQDGEEALDYLLRRGAYAAPGSAPRPEVILLDLRLPKLDGLQVLEEVRRSKAFDDLPVVVLTTSKSTEDIAQAYRYGANSYLVKPLEYDGLSRLITDFGAYWLRWNERGGEEPVAD
jgi:CheY-like chemotaxis protein